MTITVEETDGIMVASGLRAEAKRNREAAGKAQAEFPGLARNMLFYADACERIANALDVRARGKVSA